MLIVEFADAQNMAFNEIMDVLGKYSDFHKYEIQNESEISLPGLTIYPEQRKVCCGKQEVALTAKEYDLLYLLAVNKEHILTYEQIYERVWGNIGSGDEKDTVGFHIRNLRRKLDKVSPKIFFSIQCVREVGYCLIVYQK